MKTDTDNVSFMSVTTDKNMKKYRDKKKSPLLWCFKLEAWLPASWDENMYWIYQISMYLYTGVNIFMKFNSIKRERIISESSKIFILEAISETFEHNLFKSSIDKPINSLLNNWNNYLLNSYTGKNLNNKRDSWRRENALICIDRFLIHLIWLCIFFLDIID